MSGVRLISLGCEIWPDGVFALKRKRFFGSYRCLSAANRATVRRRTRRGCVRPAHPGSRNALTGGTLRRRLQRELPFAGRYRIQAQVRRSDSVDDLAFDFEVQADAPSAPAPIATASATVATPAVVATAAPATEPMVSTGALVLGCSSPP
ncbi:MAG: hypothetical protein NVS9B6_15160 [Candidatus Limnocylindrales bacterium]